MKKITLGLSLLACLLAANGRASNTLDIYWIDVEGGASTLVVTPARESVLIDTGWPSTWGGTAGLSATRIHDVTVAAGISRIDYLILTHFHIDHFGGAADLAKLIPIGHVLDNGIPDHDPDGSPNSSNFLKSIEPYREFPASDRHVMKPGQPLELKQAADTALLTYYCVGARKQFPTPSFIPTNPFCSLLTEKAVDTSDNANSIVMLLKFGPFRLFQGGDLTWNMENKLMCPYNVVGTVDIFQVSHHGMDISNSPLLVRSLEPTISIMDNGPRKGGSIATLATLRSVPSIKTMYQLHRDVRGGKEFNTDYGLIANLEQNCAGHYIKCSVDPTGKSYTITFSGTNNYTHTYQTVLNRP